MASSFDSWCFKFFPMALITLAMVISKFSVADPLPAVFSPSPWSPAHATFYGDETASETMGGGGDIAQMWVKGRKTGWISMSHNWGATYQAFATLGGQSLSFKLTSYTSKETIIAWNVTPDNWNVGSTYSADVNFH
ncbi:hypothetical protein V6N13_076193 [Hibiscus sabdariffa]